VHDALKPLLQFTHLQCWRYYARNCVLHFHVLHFHVLLFHVRHFQRPHERVSLSVCLFACFCIRPGAYFRNYMFNLVLILSRLPVAAASAHFRPSVREPASSLVSFFLCRCNLVRSRDELPPIGHRARLSTDHAHRQQNDRHGHADRQTDTGRDLV